MLFGDGGADGGGRRRVDGAAVDEDFGSQGGGEDARCGIEIDGFHVRALGDHGEDYVLLRRAVR